MDALQGSHFSDEEFYQSLGLRAGLEVHQQLLTEKKLFCRCPAGKYSYEYHAEILRHMRPTLSELGEYDGTALMEYRTRKDIIYRINDNSVCTYEMDDSPPFHIDEHSIDIALEIALLLECNIVSEIHISRKQYLDGSIPTGFQRTTVVGLDGRLPVDGSSVQVIQLGLEEDACREIEDVGHVRVFRTDRLGMPLIEVVTAPELHTPRAAYLAAQSVRTLTHSTGKVRTGSGAARQDVNVSIAGGTRVEIKGVSKISRIPYLVHNEALRQKALLEIKDELRRRGMKKSVIREVRKSVTGLLQRTDYQPIRDAITKGLDVLAVKCNGFAGLLRKEIQPGRPFLHEFSDRVRVVACLDELPNIAESDFTGDNLSSGEWHEIMKVVDAGDDDAVIVVWGDGQDLVTAVEELEGRAKEAFDGVPNETRQALSDNTNGFERILPGPDRMYPDTDLPPRKITEGQLEAISCKIGMSAARWDELAQQFDLNPHLVSGLYMSKYVELFLDIVDEKRLSPPFVASVLVDRLAKQSMKGIANPRAEEIRRVFSSLARGSINKDLVKAWADGRRGPDFIEDAESSLSGSKQGSKIEKKIRRIVGEHRPHCKNRKGIMNFYIGKIKEKVGDVVAGSEIKDILIQLELPEASAAKEF